MPAYPKRVSATECIRPGPLWWRPIHVSSAVAVWGTQTDNTSPSFTDWSPGAHLSLALRTTAVLSVEPVETSE